MTKILLALALLLPAVGLFDVVHPTLSDSSANECQSAAAPLVDGEPVKRLSALSVLLAHGMMPL